MLIRDPILLKTVMPLSTEESKCSSHSTGHTNLKESLIGLPQNWLEKLDVHGERFMVDLKQYPIRGTVPVIDPQDVLMAKSVAEYLSPSSLNNRNKIDVQKYGLEYCNKLVVPNYRSKKVKVR